MTTIEKIARAIYPTIVDGTDYSEVSFESMMSRPRYQHLKQRTFFAASEAVKAMRNDIAMRHLEAMHQAMFANSWDATDAPMVGAGFDAALDSILAEAEGEGK